MDHEPLLWPDLGVLCVGQCVTSHRFPFTDHRRWMWRGYLLLCSAVVLRLFGGLATVTGVTAVGSFDELDELARAAHGVRAAGADEAAMRIATRFVLITTRWRTGCRCRKSRSTLDARRRCSGLHEPDATIDEARVRSACVMEFCGRAKTHDQRFVRIHRSHPGDGVLLAGLDYRERRVVRVGDLRQPSRLLAKEAGIRTYRCQVTIPIKALALRHRSRARTRRGGGGCEGLRSRTTA